MKPSSIRSPDENSAWREIILNAAFNALTIGIVGLRMYSRRLTRAGFGWDDGCILVTTLLVNAMLLLAGFMISLGFGLPSDEVDRNVLEKIAELGRAFRFLFLACICAVKLSALSFYLRVFGTRVLQTNAFSQLNANTSIRSRLRKPSLRETYIALMIVVITWSAANFIQEIAVCGTDKPMCARQRDTDLSTCVFNAVGDLVILVLPLWPVWRLQMKTGTKIGLSIVFMLGIVTILVAFLRFEAIVRTAYGGDYNGTAMRSAMYAILEPNLAILCISLPMLQPLLRGMRGCVDGGFFRRFSGGFRRWRFTGLFTSGAASPAGGGDSPDKSSFSSPARSAHGTARFFESGDGEVGGRDSAGSFAGLKRVRGVGSREIGDEIALGPVPASSGESRPFEPLVLMGVRDSLGARGKNGDESV